jgi:DNA-binding GntR family transcriptional regulator
VPRKLPSFSSSLVATLKERIITWRYPPDHRLTEDALCKEFGVSRSPVREALRVLAANGFVRRTENQGYVVRQVKEMYEVRLALELYAVETLATRGVPADKLRVMIETWENVRHDPPSDVEDLAELDAQFHEGLSALLDNATLMRQLRAIDERLYLFRTMDFALPNRVANTCEQHLAILDRIGARDAAGARNALRRNIEEALNVVNNSIKEALARAYASA